MGAQETPEPAPNRTRQSFLIGPDKAHVFILKPEDLPHRNAILDAIFTLSTLRNNYSLLYLAVPRVLGTAVDAGLFRSRGIGLLFFDERRIDEAVTAQPTRIPLLRQEEAPAPGNIDSEIATLRSMYLEMDRTVNLLRNELANLRQVSGTPEEPPRIPQPIQMVTDQPVFAQPAGHELPSFFMNNPWLEVLSKRGTGEHPRLAG